jgi:chromosome segregation ATPase
MQGEEDKVLFFVFKENTMELEEKLNAALAENKHIKDAFENLTAEKVAIDITLVENLKSAINYKKDFILLQSQVQKLQSEISVLKSEKDGLEKSFADYKSKYGCPTDGVLLEG